MVAARLLLRDGERGRNRTFNLLIKSYASQCGCEIDNCSRHSDLTTKRPAWTVFEIVGKVGEIEWHLIPKDTKRPQCIRRGPDARWETIAVKEACQASWFRWSSRLTCRPMAAVVSSTPCARKITTSPDPTCSSWTRRPKALSRTGAYIGYPTLSEIPIRSHKPSRYVNNVVLALLWSDRTGAHLGVFVVLVEERHPWIRHPPFSSLSTNSAQSSWRMCMARMPPAQSLPCSTPSSSFSRSDR